MLKQGGVGGGATFCRFKVAGPAFWAAVTKMPKPKTLTGE